MSEKQQYVAVHCLIKKDGKYLLTRRSEINDFKPGEWDIPGGSVEFGEDPKAGLVREVDEESGLKIKVGRILYLYSHLSNSKRHQFQVVYECEYISGEVILNPEEHDKYEWLTWEEIAKLPLIEFMRSMVESQDR